jgi:hypothetical protein
MTKSTYWFGYILLVLLLMRFSAAVLQPHHVIGVFRFLIVFVVCTTYYLLFYKRACANSLKQQMEKDNEQN